jgi:hypothetical protein
VQCKTGDRTAEQPHKKYPGHLLSETHAGISDDQKEEIILPSKAACTLLFAVRFWLTDDGAAAGLTEETVKGPPLEDGGFVRLMDIQRHNRRSAVTESPPRPAGKGA